MMLSGSIADWGRGFKYQIDTLFKIMMAGTCYQGDFTRKCKIG